MDYFPAFLQLDDKPCLLVGGGAVAARKAKALLAAGATLTIVSPEVVPAVDDMLAGNKRLRCHQPAGRAYRRAARMRGNSPLFQPKQRDFTIAEC